MHYIIYLLGTTTKNNNDSITHESWRLTA